MKYFGFGYSTSPPIFGYTGKNTTVFVNNYSLLLDPTNPKAEEEAIFIAKQLIENDKGTFTAEFQSLPEMSSWRVVHNCELPADYICGEMIYIYQDAKAYEVKRAV